MKIEEIEEEFNRSVWLLDSDRREDSVEVWADKYGALLLKVAKAAKLATYNKKYYGDQAPLMSDIKSALEELEND